MGQDILKIQMPDGIIYDIAAEWSNIKNKPEIYTKAEVDEKITSIYKFKGSVSNYSDLPSSNLSKGDVYSVENEGCSYAWNGTDWERIGSSIDLSNYQRVIDSSNKLSSDLVDDTNHDHKFISSTEKTVWNNKYTKPNGGIPKTDLSSEVQVLLEKANSALQNHLTVDSEFIEESENPVQSQIIQEALNGKYNYVAVDSLSRINNYKQSDTIYYIKEIPSPYNAEYLKSGILIPIPDFNNGNNNFSQQCAQFLFTSDGEFLIRRRTSDGWEQNFQDFIRSDYEITGHKAHQITDVPHYNPEVEAENRRDYPSVYAVKNYVLQHCQDLLEEDETLLDYINTLSEEKADKATTLEGYGITNAQSIIDSSHKLSSDLIDDTNQTNLFIKDGERTFWNSKYTKPNTGIPLGDLSQSIQNSLHNADTALQVEQYTGTYSKPENGIPLEDLSQSIQNSLHNADTAIQSHLTVDSEFITNSENPISSQAVQTALNNRLVYRNIPYNILNSGISLNSFYQIIKDQYDTSFNDNGFMLVSSSSTGDFDRTQYIFTDKQILIRKRESEVWDSSFTTIATPIETGVIQNNNNVQYLEDDVLTIDEDYIITGSYEITNGICTVCAEAQIKPGESKVWYALPVPAAQGVAVMGTDGTYRYYIDVTDSDNLLLMKISRATGPSVISDDATVSFTLIYKC